MVLDKETAGKMFEEFCKDWRIKTDTTNFTDEDKQAFNQSKERILNAFEEGLLNILDNKNIEYTFLIPDDLENVKSVTIRRPKGATLMQSDIGKDEDKMKKMFAMMSECTKKPPSFYSKVDMIDLKVIMAVLTLFLGS
jgi:hypothetical protein